MKDIYEKLEVPEPSADLEERIIAAAAPTKKTHFFPKLAVAAACLLITLIILQPNSQQSELSESYLAEIAFFDDQYGFTDNIKFIEPEPQFEDIEFFDDQYGFADDIS